MYWKWDLPLAASCLWQTFEMCYCGVHTCMDRGDYPNYHISLNWEIWHGSRHLRVAFKPFVVYWRSFPEQNSKSECKEAYGIHFPVDGSVEDQHWAKVFHTEVRSVLPLKCYTRWANPLSVVDHRSIEKLHKSWVHWPSLKIIAELSTRRHTERKYPVSG